MSEDIDQLIEERNAEFAAMTGEADNGVPFVLDHQDNIDAARREFIDVKLDDWNVGDALERDTIIHLSDLIEALVHVEVNLLKRAQRQAIDRLNANAKEQFELACETAVKEKDALRETLRDVRRDRDDLALRASAIAGVVRRAGDLVHQVTEKAKVPIFQESETDKAYQRGLERGMTEGNFGMRAEREMPSEPESHATLLGRIAECLQNADLRRRLFTEEVEERDSRSPYNAEPSYNEWFKSL